MAINKPRTARSASTRARPERRDDAWSLGRAAFSQPESLVTLEDCGFAPAFSRHQYLKQRRENSQAFQSLSGKDRNDDLSEESALTGARPASRYQCLRQRNQGSRMMRSASARRAPVSSLAMLEELWSARGTPVGQRTKSVSRDTPSCHEDSNQSEKVPIVPSGQCPKNRFIRGTHCASKA